MLLKVLLREIKQSLGRYLAIVAIIALGVGLFSGLKGTKAVMVASADDYLREHLFFDYRMLSTYGFEEKDVIYFQEQKEIAAAEGAYTADVLYISPAGNENVMKIHSLTQSVNTLQVLFGRLPEKADECVVDSRLYSAEDIGTQIVFADANEQDTLANFAYQSYTITGIANSPLYMQFERGTTSLGNGSVSGFMYLLPEGFSMDYYTEVYVRMGVDEAIYSDAYKEAVDANRPLMESCLDTSADRRFLSIVGEAEEEIADAQDSLACEVADARSQLEEALQELNDADMEIQDAEKAVADGEQELLDASKALKIRRQELTEAQNQITQARAVLDEKKEQLAYAQSCGMLSDTELFYAELELEQGYAALDETQAQLNEGWRMLESAEKQAEQAASELEEKKAELLTAKEELKEGWLDYSEAEAELEEKVRDAEKEIADAKAELDALKRPVTYLLDRNTNIGYVCFENDSGIVQGIANVFPVFFFLVAALVCITTMNRMVEEQRTQIGVWKALGYGEGAVMCKYLLYAGSAAFIGAIGGYLLGVHFFPLVIWLAYGIMYSMGGIVYVFDIPMAFLSIATALLCSVGASFLSCRQELRSVAAVLMRPKAPKAGKRVFLEKLPFLWNRLHFLQKVSVRNIFRYKRRFFMMVIGISGCSALLVTGFGVRDSVVKIADKQFEEIQFYDLDLTLKDTGGSREADAYIKEHAAASLYVYEASWEMTDASMTKSVNLIIPMDTETFSDFCSLHTQHKEEIGFPQAGEAVITRKLADTFGASVGDFILLQNDDRQEISLKVSGICENYIYNYVYINPVTYEAAIGEVPYKNLYVRLEEDEDPHEWSAWFLQCEDVASVSVISDMLNRVASMMRSMNYIVLVIIACAGALAFVVLYNLNNINITERLREIATIKVLGFFKKETASYVFRENTVLTGIGCALGLLLGTWLHAYVMHEINIDMISFETKVETGSYLISILMTFLFAFLINRMMTGKLEKINMAESLKSVD